MIEALTLALCVVSVAYVRRTAKHNVLKKRYAELLETSQEQLREYWGFRLKFEQYRERFDPVKTTQEDNVITIKKERESDRTTY